MIQELYDYDVFPKVVLAGRENEITVKPLGWHAGIEAGKTYDLQISAMEQGEEKLYAEWADFKKITVTADADACLRFRYTFPSEQEYLISYYPKPDASPVRLSVYALAEDMKGRYPYRGDMHVHSRRSDGREAPAIVCANYRAAGYDFMTISDHRRYYPSLEAIQALEGLSKSFLVVPGEEVQLPLTDIHIINFGGHYSINALIDGNKNQNDRGDDPAFRSENGECPPVMTREQYEETIRDLARENHWFDAEMADTSFAACVWAFDQIRKAQGMSIFCHPYWRYRSTFQVPEKFLDLIFSMHPFDAFEVLGGESYYEHNGFQTARYYEEQAKGHRFPIVGDTDTHGSTEHNRDGRISSTIVFSPGNTREKLIESIRSFYTVAVDTISKEFRLVGSLRFQKYGCFLMKQYFPLHDRLCAIEGEYIRQAVVGEEGARERLALIADDQNRMMKKYFALD